MSHIFIDPGFRALGVVIYDAVGNSIQDHGALLSDPKDYATAKAALGASKADAEFMEQVAKFLTKFNKKHKPEKVFLELPHGGQSFRAVKMLSQVSGTVIGWATAYGKPMVYYTPERNKKTATGDIHASKELMELAVRRRWPSPLWAQLPDSERNHIVDAAALILAAQAAGDI